MIISSFIFKRFLSFHLYLAFSSLLSNNRFDSDRIHTTQLVGFRVRYDFYSTLLIFNKVDWIAYLQVFLSLSKIRANVATLIDNRIIQGLCGICNGKIHDDILPPALQSFMFFAQQPHIRKKLHQLLQRDLCIFSRNVSLHAYID